MKTLLLVLFSAFALISGVESKLAGRCILKGGGKGSYSVEQQGSDCMFDFSGDTPPCNPDVGCVGGAKLAAICCESCSKCDSNCGWVLGDVCQSYTA